MFLSLVFHNHQPVGQLPWAFEDVWRDSYSPFLEVLEQHPTIKIGLHYTGPLLDWLQQHRPQTIEQIQRLVAQGQVEILGGGLYEPILAIWPESDQQAQIQGLSRCLAELFGVAPHGAWLAERVWEPQLAPVIRECGVKYTLVDSSVFETAGLAEADLVGYFHAPRSTPHTKPLAIFPINQALRQLIPWQEPAQTIEYLGRLASSSSGDSLGVFADDGEKFGGWPGTFEWVFVSGWLDRFFTTLESNSNWLQTITPAEYISSHAPLSEVVLPTGSYAEMQQWSGGNWRNFLTRYSESGDMYREVMRAHAAVQTAMAQEPDKPEHRRAYDHVLRAQSNDGYWHGIFGGLYLRHLRQSVYAEAAAAQTLVQKVELLAIEREEDGKIVLQNASQKLLFDPAGGALSLWLSKTARHNLLATLQRRREPYHEADLPTDWYPRTALLDHFFGDAVNPEVFATAAYAEQGDFVTEAWQFEESSCRDKATITATRAGGVWVGDSFVPLTIAKHVTLQAGSDRLQVEYSFLSKAAQPIDLWWGHEWNVVLSGSQLPERHYHADDHQHKLDLNQAAQFAEVQNPIVADRWPQLWVEWEFDEPVDLWHVPLQTVSQKEGGEIEETYQQSAFVFHRRLRLLPLQPFTTSFGVLLTAKRQL